MEQANRHGLEELPDGRVVVGKDRSGTISLDEIDAEAIIEAMRLQDPDASVVVQLSGSFNTRSGPVTVTRNVTLTLEEIAEVLGRR